MYIYFFPCHFVVIQFKYSKYEQINWSVQLLQIYKHLSIPYILLYLWQMALSLKLVKILVASF